MKFTIFTTVGLFLFLTSCSTVYRSNLAHTVFFEQPGDMNLSASVGSAGFEGQVSAALTPHVFIFGGGSYFNEDSSKISKIDYVYYKYMESGLGYYHSFAGKWRITASIGLGKGNSKTLDYSEEFFGDDYEFIETNGEFNKYFIQNTIGFTTKVINLGGSIRYNYLDFYKYRYDKNPQIAVNNHFIEPTFFIKVGWKNIRYHLQASMIYPLRNQSPFDFHPYRLAAGASFNFNAFKKDSSK